MALRDGLEPGTPRPDFEVGIAAASRAPIADRAAAEGAAPASSRPLDLAPASPARAGADGSRPASEGPSCCGRPAGDPSAGQGSAQAAPRPVRTDAVPAPPLADDELEEVAVCGLCGLVAREPAPPVCPACGGGYG